MKLYTEEQVRWAFRNGHIYAHLNEVDENEFMGELVPIELPSDEEIGEQFKNYTENWEIRQALEVGAKWMRDKLQGGNNEQQ